MYVLKLLYAEEKHTLPVEIVGALRGLASSAARKDLAPELVVCTHLPDFRLSVCDQVFSPSFFQWTADKFVTR